MVAVFLSAESVVLLYRSNQMCTPGVEEKPGLVAWPPDLIAKGTRRLAMTLICGANSQYHENTAVNDFSAILPQQIHPPSIRH